MKKWILQISAFLLVIALTACSQQTVDNNPPETPQSQVVAPAEGDAEEAKVLVAYFSRTGTTEKVAQWIQETAGGDLFQIQTVEAYPDDYDETLEIARREREEQARPALQTQVENMADYDVVFLGYPIWFSDMPMAVYSFLEAYDLSGKTVVPFCTSGGSGISATVGSIREQQAEATILEGLSLFNSEVDDSQEEVQAWLQGLQLEGLESGSADVLTEEIRIRLTFDGGEAIAVLYDNPTTQSLLAQLPATVTGSDYAGAEKIAYFAEPLSTQDAPPGDDPEIGDVACYGPWGNLAVYYNDQVYASGLIPMGRVESGLEALGAMTEDFALTIEQID